MPHFIGYLSEEGTILLSKFGRRLVKFFIYVQNHAGGWLQFHLMVHALPGGLVIQIKSYFIGVAQLPLFNDRSSLIRACGLESKSFQKNLLHCHRLWHMLTFFISDDGTSSVLCNIKGRRIQKVRLTNREECEKYSWIFY